MAKPAKKKAAKKRVAVRDPMSDVEELEGVELGNVLDEIGIEARLAEWAALVNPECLTIRTYVYKYEHPTTGDHKVLCDRIDSEIPDPHSIGLMYGAGRYMMIVSVPVGSTQPKAGKGLRFRLHARYDELMAQSKQGQLPGDVAPATAAPAATPQSSMKDGIEMVRVVVDMLKPLLESRAAATPAAPDMSHLLESQYSMMSSVLKKSLHDSQDLIAQVNQARLEGGVGADDDEEPDFIAKVMPLLDQFLPAMMGGGATAKVTADAVRALPEFAQLMQNAQELRRVVAWLDETQGQKKTNKILNVLKVGRPGTNGKASKPRRAPSKAKA